MCSKIDGAIRQSKRQTTGIRGTWCKFAISIKDTGSKFCHVCQQYRWQTIGTISDCWPLKVNLKEKIYLYVNSTTQRCPSKISKTFLIEDFFHLPPVSMTPVVHLELGISLPIFENIWNGPKGILRGLGKLIHKKTWSLKYCGTVPLIILWTWPAPLCPLMLVMPCWTTVIQKAHLGLGLPHCLSSAIKHTGTAYSPLMFFLYRYMSVMLLHLPFLSALRPIMPLTCENMSILSMSKLSFVTLSWDWKHKE